MKFGKSFFSSKYESIYPVKFSIWRYSFNIAAMMSFHAKKCCHPMSVDAASAKVYHRIFLITLSNVDQFSKFFHRHTSWEVCNTVNISPHVKRVSTLLCEIFMLEKLAKIINKCSSSHLLAEKVIEQFNILTTMRVTAFCTTITFVQNVHPLLTRKL